MTKIDDLLQERYALAQKAREVIKAAEGRELTAEERSSYDKIMADVDKIGERVETLKADDARDSKLSALEKEMEQPRSKAVKPEIGDRSDNRAKTETEEYRKAFGTYLASVSKVDEIRALQMDLDSFGGYTVPPQQFVAELIQKIKEQFVMRGISTVRSVPGAASLGVPTLTTRPGDPVWTSEIGTLSVDNTTRFGKRELRPQPLAQLVQVSKDLVQMSPLSIEAEVKTQLAHVLGYVEDYGFLNGSGVNQPLGVFTANANGINTTQDVSTGNTDTEIRAEGLIEAVYTLRPGYHPRAKWIFHQNAIKQIRKLRGNDGDFLWQPGLSRDRGDTLLGFPVLLSELAPHTFTTGLYVGILGDFSYYWIADSQETTLQVLTELYAASNLNGYIIRKKTDGAPVLEEAFVRVTLA